MRYEVLILNNQTDHNLLASFFNQHFVADYVVKGITQYGHNYLFIIIDGEIKSYRGDRGEPEDNTFLRDWSWVAPALEEAYAKGYEHSKERYKK